MLTDGWVLPLRSSTYSSVSVVLTSFNNWYLSSSGYEIVYTIVIFHEDRKGIRCAFPYTNKF